MIRARYATFAIFVAFGILFVPTAARRTEAMPTFAQAYGLDRKVCHTEVPSLNAYGRYVQRTTYAGLDPSGYKHEFPLWVSARGNYDSTSDSPKVQVGNIAMHAVGVTSNWTDHVQQWIVQNNEAGGLDTMWVSYNKLFGGNGHLVVGRMPGPGPSFWSMRNDASGFTAPSITIGQHTQSLASNRWGAKLNYGTEKFFAEAGYYGSSADLNGATQWGATSDNGVDKGVQWHAAFQRPGKPVSAGIVGNSGTVQLADGGSTGTRR